MNPKSRALTVKLFMMLKLFIDLMQFVVLNPSLKQASVVSVLRMIRAVAAISKIQSL